MSQTEAIISQLREWQDSQKSQVTVRDTDMLLVRRGDGVEASYAPFVQGLRHGNCVRDR
jgi:hypothetical protein